MQLKRLELFGFKSFADKTVMEFPETLTGIVGPNGCGKSNVVDAIRWVLGETRPTSMRGSGMTDVIFKGSASRPAMSIAEVTMVLDNGAGRLEDRGPEVSLTRRVEQSGEGEYLIDGVRARLKDVRDMLFDTGLGSRGYAVLEQGRIDAILSANALDRRAIFEEAAGVSRYRQRKKEAESRLKRVEQDMLRLDDVIQELSGRVRSLKMQAGKAEKYIAVRDEWRDGLLRLLQHRLAQGDGDVAELARALDELERRAEELRRTRTAGEESLSEREARERDLTGEVDRRTEAVSSLSGDVRALGERHEQLLSRIEGWRQAAGEEEARLDELRAQLEAGDAEARALEESVREATDAQAAAEAEAQGRSEALRDARREYREVREGSETQNQAVLELLHEKTAAANRRRHLEESRAGLDGRTARVGERLEAARGGAKDVAAAVEAARAAQAEWATTPAVRRGHILHQICNALEARSEELLDRKNAIELERARGAARVASLRDWEREREGLEAGTRALLEEGTAPGPFADALRGVLADHVRTDTRYARALDAALEGRALGLVVDEPATAREIARWLQREERGQARLVAAGGLARRELPPLPQLEGDRVELVYGRLSEFVVADDPARGLVELLVGDVVLVRDLDAALELVREHPALRFVTPGGDLVDATGLVGGHREIAQGAVGRRSSADELEREAGRLASELDEVGELLSRADAERSAVRAELAAVEQELESALRGQAEATSDAQAAAARRVDLESSLEVVEGEARSLEEEIAQLERDVAAAGEAQADAERRFGEENARLAELEERRHALERGRDDLAAAEQAARIAATEAAGVRQRVEQQLADARRLAEAARAELERAETRARQHRENADAKAAEVEALLAERADAEGRLAAAQAALAELRAQESASREALQASRREVDAVTRELEDVLSRSSEHRLEKQRLDLAREELLRRSDDELGLDEAGLREGFEPDEALAEPGALDRLDKRVAASKRDLDRLGPVNTEALSELEEIEGRFVFLRQQKTDLQESRGSLEETLRTINEESKRRFLETFTEVREHFQGLFRSLFGGGRADLELLDPEDPLEAGIEIVARPPGREMLPIGLLSGGQRTMTALALLFAVFKSRPSPFCVLDEVDAALDDANIGRFLHMLDGFIKDTQFLIVTHNKGTMAACRSLYGVTMETRGVSRHVAVEFTDVDDFVPEATGDARAAAEARDEAGTGAPAAGSADDDAEPEASADDDATATDVLVPRPPPGAAGEPGEPEPAVEDGEAAAAVAGRNGGPT